MDVGYLDLEDMEDIELLETFRQPNKYRTRINPFEQLSDQEFLYKYRFSKNFAHKIVEIVRDELPQDTRGAAVSPQIQVVSALRNWARHEIQDDTADLHGLSQPVISKICKNVANALAKVSHRYIKMPSTLGEQEEIMRKFRNISNFPKVIGAIDCTHIKIKKVNRNDGQTYINRKGFPSINVQVVCDADLKIMDIVARWRGSVHDSRIFRESRLKQRFEAGAFSGVLLGDNGYPCTSYLFTPILRPTSVKERIYNRAHIQTRNTVERCFGILKQRFRCLLRGLFGNIDTARTTIVACAVLHNIATAMKENIFPVEENIEQPSQLASMQENVNNTLRGNIRRQQFIERYF